MWNKAVYIDIGFSMDFDDFPDNKHTITLFGSALTLNEAVHSLYRESRLLYKRFFNSRNNQFMQQPGSLSQAQVKHVLYP